MMNILMKSGGIIVFPSEYVTINIVLLHCTMLNFFSLFHSLIIITDLHQNKLTNFARVKGLSLNLNHHLIVQVGVWAAQKRDVWACVNVYRWV